MPGLITNRLQGFGQRKPGPAYQVDPSHPLAKGFAAAWLFNEGGGDHFYSVAGDRRNVLIGNEPPGGGSIPAKKPGRFVAPCLDFTGGTAYAAKTTPVGIPAGATARSFVVWARKHDVTGGTIFAYGDAAGGGQEFIFQDFNTGGQDFWFTDGVNGANNQTHDEAADHGVVDIWGMYVVTIDGNNGFKYYFGRDGQRVGLRASGTWSVALNTATPTKFGVGTRVDGVAQNWTGNIDHLLCWSRELSAAEIVWLYNEPFAFMSRPAPRRTFFGPAFQPPVPGINTRLTTWPPIALGRFGAGAAAPAAAGKFQPAWARRGVIIGGGVY